MQKMTLQALKDLYQLHVPKEKEDRDGKIVRARCTQKNHRHIVRPVWLPGVPFIRPAEHRRRHLEVSAPAVVISSPKVELKPTPKRDAFYIPVVSTSGKQNNPAYRKQFGSRAKKK
jgi:hypothetical protein